jgi:hypothetical protein
VLPPRLELFDVAKLQRNSLCDKDFPYLLNIFKEKVAHPHGQATPKHLNFNKSIH